MIRGAEANALSVSIELSGYDYRHCQCRVSACKLLLDIFPNIITNTFIMRELKFRAWSTCTFDGKNSMMELDPRQGFDGQDLVSHKGWAVMQFTGLADKNGTPIYEGDIVFCKAHGQWKSTEDDNVKAVISCAHDGQWQCIYQGRENGLPVVWGGYETIEIIGNLYKNPELLA